MSRFKKGDIILNKYAAPRNPIRIGVYIGNGYLIQYYAGKFHKYTLIDLEQDTEHFVVIGHEPITDLFNEMMKKYNELKEEL